MAMIVSAIESVTVICPHCGEHTEVMDPEIACTATGVDVMTTNGQGVNHCICDECGDEFLVSAHCSLAVSICSKRAA